MKLTRDLLLLGLLFAALLALTALGAGAQRGQSVELRPTSYASGPGGALALLRWFQELGYDARRLEYRPFTLEERDKALVILNPSEPINRTEAGEVLRWVEAGGTLIMADDQGRLFGGDNALLRELGVGTRFYEGSIERAPAVQPVLDQPPVREVLVETDLVLELENSDYARLLGPPGESVLVGIKRGAGYIYLSAATLPFTNQGLHDAGNAALLLNMLRRVPAGGRILFDEYHHGFFTPPSLRTLVLSQPWGWALLYALALCAAYLALSGRRFGRPVPLREELARRSSAEYVDSMADLFQRGGKRSYILRHYLTALKRRLARPYGINPQLDNLRFVQELARHRPLDQQGLLAQLEQMGRAEVSEEQLLRLAMEGDKC